VFKSIVKSVVKNKRNISNLHKILKSSNYQLYLTKVGQDKREDKIFNSFLDDLKKNGIKVKKIK
jgi:hypothetical protein|tara:strand:- start:103 stop:294 length:192 start_codon:yes stop_codon:yes gene_type:complete